MTNSAYIMKTAGIWFMDSKATLVALSNLYLLQRNGDKKAY